MGFKKFNPNEYVIVIKKGQTVKEGSGLSLWFNELSTSIMVVPQTAFDGDFFFDELVTSDYQAVSVQGNTTYMITDYAKAAQMLDFSYNPNEKNKQEQTLKVLENRINNIIKAIVIREVSRKDIRSIIRLADEMAGEVQQSLQADEAVAKLGVSIIAVNILGIAPKSETRKALEAAAREQILKEQDDAIYKRRNAAIEQERVIRENEISTEIAVAEKEKEKEEKEQQLREYVQKCELERKMKEMRAELEMSETSIQSKIEIEKKNKELSELSAASERIKADAKAYATEKMVAAYNGLNEKLIEACALADTDPSNLMARAFMKIGENAGKIGTLNFTPDMLDTIAAGLKRND